MFFEQFKVCIDNNTFRLSLDVEFEGFGDPDWSGQNDYLGRLEVVLS